ncbi:MAG: 2-oxoacid:acceptor oxidoreductase subunit alpha [Candidatus Omnitrophica bacterium]|nr:2-oxoacid:acceptor oxidoreductase subunit alpha [Candidatus Omnitrophota bacterium]
MNEFSVLIGGKAGFGIDKASLIIASLLGQLGYRSYIYRDYPSLIRGGHTFSIIRASTEKVATYRDQIDALLALNQETVDLHKARLKGSGIIIYDSDSVNAGTVSGVKNAIGLPLTSIIKEEKAGEIMRNTCIIGAFAKSISIEWNTLDATFRKNFSKELDQNLKVARRAFDTSKEFTALKKLAKERLPLVTGNEAVALGLVRAGLKSYIAYPMTPSSPILHYLANLAEEFDLKVVHPESEISVIMMALGIVYCGHKVAVGTSGGGFCLMTEGLSFSGMAELPVVIVMGQRPGPSTGLPTYSCQTELQFVLSAGQGEFTRFVIAPGDAEEAYYASQLALQISWKYQIPSIVLTDKAMAEGTYSFDIGSCDEIKEEAAALWDGRPPYKRYSNTDSGVSPLAFPGKPGVVIKANSYEHDEAGISTEDPAVTVKMQDKRLRKEKYLAAELENYESVKVHGNKNSATALLCWGSNKGVCVEIANMLNLKVIQPVIMSPFPAGRFRKALEGVNKVIAVENNAMGQLTKVINTYGFNVNASILKYDGRDFSLEELEDRVRKVIG